MLETPIRELSRYCKKKTTLSVVCDGRNLKRLQGLLEKGIAVRYLSTLPIRDEFKHPLLECKLLKEPESIRTFHFTYAEHPKMLWLERSHPAGISQAYDCEWVPPALASDEPRGRYEKVKSIFEEAWSKACTTLDHFPERLGQNFPPLQVGGYSKPDHYKASNS